MSAKKSAQKKPDPPKKALSAYFLFLGDVRPQLKKENPDASIGDISKLAGERWANLDNSEKAKYQKRQEDVKKEYERVRAEYEANYGPIPKKKSKKAKANDSDDDGGKQAKRAPKKK